MSLQNNVSLLGHIIGVDTAFYFSGLQGPLGFLYMLLSYPSVRAKNLNNCPGPGQLGPGQWGPGARISTPDHLREG